MGIAMKILRFAVLTTTMLFVAACYVTTTTPVGSTAGFRADPDLIGTWGKSDTDCCVTFIDNGDGTMTERDTNADNSNLQVYTIQAATLGKNHFLNARSVIENGEPATGGGTPTVSLYRIRNGMLRFAQLDEERVRLAIKFGEIEGTIDPERGGDAHITAEPAAQDRLFATREGAALFGKWSEPLHKIN
jgi:hypothetical protein